jgi:hypothetical protein
MTESEARGRLRELVALRQDCERFQRALGAVSICPELKSSAPQQLAHLAGDAKRKADALEADLARVFAGSRTPLWSDAGESGGALSGSDPCGTVPRV